MPKTLKSEDTVLRIQAKANKARELIIEMLEEAGSGHSAGSLGTADIFAALYFHILNVNPKKPEDPDRDRFLLSNGHICPVWYATLHLKGYFPKKELYTLRKINSRLQGHPHNLSLPGVESSGGPLGQGLSQAIGMALAAKLDKKTYRTFCMTGDGELNEGQIWEAAMSAPKFDLTNLTWIIDRNNIQIEGFTEEVMPLEPLREKLESFNWNVEEIDGHNIEEIIDVVQKAKAITQRPTAIIAHTIPGKGVKFMEYDYKWHGMPPNKEQAKKALHDIRTLNGKIEYV